MNERPLPPESEREQISESIDAVLDFHAREESKVSYSQRQLERFSDMVGQPMFLAIILLFVSTWVLANALLRMFGLAQFDPPPFSYLQGIIGLAALLTTTAVLSKQNRIAKLAEQREHLDLNIALLTERKVAKLIHLLEELRRDMPNVINRSDTEAIAMQRSMSPDSVLAALDERGAADDRSAFSQEVDQSKSSK